MTMMMVEEDEDDADWSIFPVVTYRIFYRSVDPVQSLGTSRTD